MTPQERPDLFYRWLQIWMAGGPDPHGETGNIAAAPEQTIDGVQHQKRDPYQVVSCRKERDYPSPAPMRCGDAGRATQLTTEPPNVS